MKMNISITIWAMAAIALGAFVDAVAQERPEESLRIHRYGSAHTAPYDAFQYLNRLNAEFAEGDTPEQFSGRLFGRLGNQEGRILIKIPQGFDRDTYEGFKTFYRTEGDKSVGNCVACHQPPEFTDNLFHNTGVSRDEYEAVHGAGSFSKLDIPKAGEAVRPSKRLGSEPKAGKPGQANLGRWNSVDLDDSSLRKDGESKDTFLARMIGAFKTPSLRDLAGTSPFNHSGPYKSLEDVIAQKIRASNLAKQGDAPHTHEAFKTMNLSEEDIPGLVKFLKTLNELPEEEFRKIVLSPEILDTTYLFE